MRRYFIILLSITVLNAESLDEMLINMRAKKLDMIEKIGHEIVTYYTQEKKKIRLKKVFDEYKRLLYKSRYSYYTGKLEEKIIFEYDNNSTKKSRPITIRKITYREDGSIWQDYKKNIKEKFRVYNKFYYDNGTSSIEYYAKGRRAKVIKIVTLDKNDEIVNEEYRDGSRRVISKYKNNKLSTKKEYSYEIEEAQNILDGKSAYYDENGTIREIEYYEDGALKFTSQCSFDTRHYMESLEQGKYYERSAKYEKFGEICYKFREDKVLILSLYNSKKPSNRTTLWLVVIDPKKRKVKQEYFYTSKVILDVESYSLTNSTYRSVIDENVIDLVAETRDGRYEYDTIYESFNIQERRVIVLKQPTFDMRTIEGELEEKKVSINMIKGMLFEKPISKTNVDVYRNIVELLKRKGNNESQKFLEVQLANFLMFSDDEFKSYFVKKRLKFKVHSLIQEGFGRSYRTRLKKALASKKRPFAGEYVVAHWGCDEGKNSCGTGGIVSTSTGKAVPFPFKYYAYNGKQSISYRFDSSLFVVAGDFEFPDGTKSKNEIRFYNFEDGAFMFLKSYRFRF